MSIDITKPSGEVSETVFNRKPVNSIDEWSDIIRRQGEESRARQDARDARFDKIIAELKADDPQWWVNYPEGRSIMVLIGQRMSLPHTVEGDKEHGRITRSITTQERTIVASYIVPAMYACIRAGYVTPKEQS